jgi:hypothetical protein
MAEKKTSEEKPSPMKRAWEAIGAFSRVRTIWQLVAATGIASEVVSRLPGGWHPPQYWALAAFAFFGTWAIVASVMFIIERSLPPIRRVLNPPKGRVIVDSGNKGSFTVRHSGAPCLYSANGRIVLTFDSSPNPAPQLFQAELYFKGLRGGYSVELRDGDWANVIVAQTEGNNYDRTWLAIRRGSYGSTVIVPDRGVMVEYELVTAAVLSEQDRVLELEVSCKKGSHIEVARMKAESKALR